MRPPGFSRADGAVEDRCLILHALLQRAGPDPPLGIRIAPPGAGAGAGRVDQHQIDAAREVGEFVAHRARRAHLHIAHARALEPGMDRRQPPLVGIGGVDLALVLHRGGERQRLAAGAGAEIDHLLAGLCAGQQRGKLRAFVLDFDQAFDEGRLGMDRGAFRAGVELDAQAGGRPARRLGMEIAQRGDRLVARRPSAY